MIQNFTTASIDFSCAHEDRFFKRNEFFDNKLIDIGLCFSSSDLLSLLASLRMAYGPIQEKIDEDFMHCHEEEIKYIKILRLKFISIESYLLHKIRGVKILEHMLLVEEAYLYNTVGIGSLNEYICHIKTIFPDMYAYALYIHVCLITKHHPLLRAA